MANNIKHLYNLDELSDYKVADGYQNVKGWEVKDIDNRVIGKVDNLLVNKEAQRVVYLDIEVDKTIIDAHHDPYKGKSGDDINQFINKDGENHLILPIGLVEVNEDPDYVYTNRINHQTFAGTKRYRKGDTINRNYENQVLDSYNRINEDGLTKDENKNQNERRIREIVRQEIRRYNNIYGKDSTRYSDDIKDEVIMPDEVIMADEELERRRKNNDIYDDGDYYDRSEFDDHKFRNRKSEL